MHARPVELVSEAVGGRILSDPRKIYLIISLTNMAPVTV